MAVAAAASVLRLRLASAFRTALACTIVGCTALYAPTSVRLQLRFPSLSYVTAILIVSDATLGDTLRGCWHAITATVLVFPPSIVCLLLISPARFTAGSAGLAVAVNAFFVALLPISLLSKRIAFGELVIVYVGAVVHGHDRPDVGTSFIMHPTHVAASAALGAFASLIALLLPFPWLGFTEVKRQYQLYRENASERINLLVKAFVSHDDATAHEFISQAEPFAETGAKLLQHSKLLQEGVKWERPWTRDHYAASSPGDRLQQDIETPIRGMEIALTACHTNSFPAKSSMIMDSQDLHDSLLLISTQVQQALITVLDDEQAASKRSKPHLPSNLIPKPAEGMPSGKSFLQSLATFPPTPNDHDLPAFFFLSCTQLLLSNLTSTSCHQKAKHSEDQSDERSTFQKFLDMLSDIATPPSNKALVFAFKCSVALGLAVILGLTFNKENGYWSGLTIAISFVKERQPLFTVANARVQGTALGSVYGVIGCFLLQRINEIRLVILLPWIIFTSFLRHSEMYGQAGGISAVIGALLILGRKNYGPPDEFAIARLTEASIGLLCLIIVEVILQPARAATLAKHQLSKSLEILHQCIDQIVLSSTAEKEENGGASTSVLFLETRENQLRKLKSHMAKLIKFIKEAESEPNFWFLPFRASCYYKIHKTLSRMMDVLQFMSYSMDLLFQVSPCAHWRELVSKHIKDDLELWNERLGPCLKRLEKISLIKSIDAFEQAMQQGKIFQDLESGKSITLDVKGVSTSCHHDTGAPDEVLCSFLQHSKELIGKSLADEEGEEESRGEALLHLNALAFCISLLTREAKQVEEGIKDLVRWENPSRRLDFRQLFSKIDAAGS